MFFDTKRKKPGRGTVRLSFFILENKSKAKKAQPKNKFTCLLVAFSYAQNSNSLFGRAFLVKRRVEPLYSAFCPFWKKGP